MTTTTPLICALLIGATTTAFAADNTDNMGKGDSYVITDTHQATTAKADQKFIDAAMVGGMLEIQASRLALTQDNLPDNVKDAARTMVDDHTRLDDQLQRIATAKGFSLPSELDKSARSRLDRLQEVSGKGLDFLKAYDSYLVKSHKDAISLFEDQAKDTTDPDLKAFALDNLPTLRHHADMVSTLPYAKEENSWWKIW